MPDHDTVRRPRRWVLWLLLALSAALLAAASWFCFTTHPKVAGLRNILAYKAVHRRGTPAVRAGALPGALSGTVRDDEGRPVAGAVVLVASRLGHTFTSETGPDGTYAIGGLPPGRYVPVAAKRGYVDALPQRCLAGLCAKQARTIRPGREVRAPGLTLAPEAPPRLMIDGSLVISPTQTVQTRAPLPGRADRTRFSFERGGVRDAECFLYEPEGAAGPYPALFQVLPGPVLNWEIVAVPFAAQGYSVLACYPFRGTDIDGDVVDLLTALEYFRRGRLPSHADLSRLGLIGASWTSIHSYRLLETTEEFDVALILGGLADAFAFRLASEQGTAYARPPFDQVLMALGFPNTSPEQYFKFSVRYHLQDLPPLCLLHGTTDELLPFEQSALLDQVLTRRGLEHRTFFYEGLTHYFSTSAEDATTQQMFRDSLDCLGERLGTGAAPAP
ncbi:MAG TPA: carboxypeptidase regulatory-like domain-containing protein [Anaerolineae bacterium]|nr:carboxypeptidase regulatory-like domain-containing protein [Anaerolineae bacterium]